MAIRSALPTDRMVAFAERLAREKRVDLPAGYAKDFEICCRFLTLLDVEERQNEGSYPHLMSPRADVLPVQSSLQRRIEGDHSASPGRTQCRFHRAYLVS